MPRRSRGPSGRHCLDHVGRTVRREDAREPEACGIQQGLVLRERPLATPHRDQHDEVEGPRRVRLEARREHGLDDQQAPPVRDRLATGTAGSRSPVRRPSRAGSRTAGTGRLPPARPGRSPHRRRRPARRRPPRRDRRGTARPRAGGRTGCPARRRAACSIAARRWPRPPPTSTISRASVRSQAAATATAASCCAPAIAASNSAPHAGSRRACSKNGAPMTSAKAGAPVRRLESGASKNVRQIGAPITNHARSEPSTSDRSSAPTGVRPNRAVRAVRRGPRPTRGSAAAWPARRRWFPSARPSRRGIERPVGQRVREAQLGGRLEAPTWRSPRRRTPSGRWPRAGDRFTILGRGLSRPRRSGPARTARSSRAGRSGTSSGGLSGRQRRNVVACRNRSPWRWS